MTTRSISLAHTLCVGIALTLSVAASAAADLPRARLAIQRQAISAPSGPGSPKVSFRKFAAKPTADKIGIIQTGWFCGASQDIRFTQEFVNLVTRDVQRVVNKELTAAGYGRAIENESVFAGNTPPPSADYELGATLIDSQFYACERDKIMQGTMWVQMRWELFSPKLQKVVYSVTTEGSAELVDAERQPFTELTQRTFASATRNLLADPALAEQLRKALDAKDASASANSPLLRIAQRGSGTQKLQDRVPQLQSSVATLFSGNGSGSGFFIQADGYLLTNHHVVGDAKYVKVKLANGRELVGEVLRSDRARDVALVKTEAVALAPMELASDEARAGDDVYALGSPLGETFASSLTRGVISGTREVEGQRWLQSDVKILPGSSGGPLLGKDGTVVGMTSRGLGAGMVGINLFIPIRDAMKTLQLDFAANK
jgi:serine protease Do